VCVAHTAPAGAKPQSDAEKDAIARMMAAQQSYTANKASEESNSKEKDKEKEGGFFKRLFGWA
jgi:hypothetical protein